MNFSKFKLHYETKTGHQISSTGSCRCPAHDDKSPSLSVKEGDDGRTLLHCHAGCDTENVVAVLGLTMADLMPDAGHNGYTSSPKGNSGNKVHPDLDAAVKASLWSIQQKYTGTAVGGVWNYCNTSGENYAAVARFDLPARDGGKPGKEFRPFRKVSGGWQCGDPDRWEPYRIEKIVKNEPVCLVEGEKCADALAKLGFNAVTSAHGAKSAGKTCWEALKDCTSIYLFPDNDSAGEKYINTAVHALRQAGFAGTFNRVELPGVTEHGDIANWIAGRPENETEEQKKADLGQIISDAAEYEPPMVPSADDSPPSEAKERNGNKIAAADAIIELAAGDKFFHDADGLAHVCLECDNAKDGPPGRHRETWPVESKSYRRILAARYYHTYKKAPDDSAANNAVSTLEHKALAGELHVVGVRRIHHDGKIYLDLANVTWTVIEIDAENWRICPNPPVYFLRKNGMGPLPTPQHGGNFDDLRHLVNVPDDNDWILIKAWLLSVFNGNMPLPILAVNGEQGSAKSTLCQMLRRLVDPNKALLRTISKDERDLIISANNNLILAFDNLSGLSATMADALCRISTGAGYSTRALYSDSEESIFAGKRSVIINGIEDLASRADLLDRCITVQLPAILDDQRKNEADLWMEFNGLHPQLLGALLEAVSAALKALPTTNVDKPPRMADFANWAVAGEAALKIPPGGFLAAYRENIGGSNEAALESSLIFEPLKKLLDNCADQQWQGPAGELLKRLSIEAGYTDSTGQELHKPPHGWPGNARAMAGKLTRITPNLRKIGIDVRGEPRTKKSRSITISLHPSSNLSEIQSSPSPPPLNHKNSGVIDGYSKNGFASPTVTTVTKPPPCGPHAPGIPSPETGFASPTVTGESATNPDFPNAGDGDDGDDGIAACSYLKDAAGMAGGTI